MPVAPSAVEVDSLIEMLPNVVLSIREDKYEHLDTMWADTAKDTVFPKVWRLFFRVPAFLPRACFCFCSPLEKVCCSPFSELLTGLVVSPMRSVEDIKECA